MSTPTNDGGPAFPTKVSDYKCTEQVADDLFSFSGPFPGMSLRDYFAAKAIPALTQEWGEDHEEVASQAYLIADAMLSARNQTTT